MLLKPGCFFIFFFSMEKPVQFKAIFFSDMRSGFRKLCLMFNEILAERFKIPADDFGIAGSDLNRGGLLLFCHGKSPYFIRFCFYYILSGVPSQDKQDKNAGSLRKDLTDSANPSILE